MTPMTPPASATAEWTHRYNADVLLVNGRPTATVHQARPGRWQATRLRVDRRTYYTTRADAMRSVTPSWAIDLVRDV